MSNTRIIEIPATMQTGKGKNHAIRKLRVAAYCRVSTEEEEQQSSFETQKLYYTEKITSTPEWEIAGIYADDGISGVHTKKRDGFNQMIKKRLEADDVLTARGNKKWSSESVQRILQNEKYCGDVLLQKTFIEDVLTGVSKKNTGQLPQYYIENNHEGIVTKQTFREAQAEIARRNSKSATNHRKRHRGRYNSKYALSERLVCGDCGSSYKRVTWSIHGRKQIVWRCVNRLEYGTKFCSNSPSIPETELHQAILKAVQNLAAKFTGEVADQLNGILHQIEVGESLTPQLQAQLEQNQQEFDHLLEMSLDFDENTPFLDDKLKRLSDKIKQLKTAITQSSVNSQTPSTPTNPITAKDLLITEYDDMLTARIIEKIIVKSRQDLEIIFIGGYTQQISLQ